MTAKAPRYAKGRQVQILQNKTRGCKTTAQEQLTTTLEIPGVLGALAVNRLAEATAAILLLRRQLLVAYELWNHSLVMLLAEQ